MKKVFGVLLMIFCLFYWLRIKQSAKNYSFILEKKVISQQQDVTSKTELSLNTENKDSSDTLLKNVSVTFNKSKIETAIDSYNTEKLKNDVPKTYFIGRYEYELAGWLERTHNETQNLELILKKIENLVDGSSVYQSLTSNGVRFWQETNAEGAVVAEEFEFVNGSKLSKKYNSTGNLEALFFQQSTGYAFSAEYNDSNHLVRIIRSVKGQAKVYMPPH